MLAPASTFSRFHQHALPRDGSIEQWAREAQINRQAAIRLGLLPQSSLLGGEDAVEGLEPIFVPLPRG